MSTTELVERMKSSKPYVLVDARSIELYNRGHIPGAVSIQEENVETNAGKYDRNTDMIVYGSVIYSKESTMTSIRFARMGFTHVYDYGDGMSDWIMSGCHTGA
jgi:rhodanese-related sulfurtransferase